MLQLRQTGLYWLWVTFIVWVVDQTTKLWVVNALPYGFSGLEVTPFFNLVHVYNTGAAFSFLADQSGWQRWFFVILTFVISGFLVYWLRRLPKEHKWESIAYTLILGGACGNVTDRIYLGYVVDFLDFHWYQYHWPSFNIADTAVCLGAGLLVLLALFKPQEERETCPKP